MKCIVGALMRMRSTSDFPYSFKILNRRFFFFVLLISVWDEFASFMVQRLPDLASGRLPSRTLCHCWAIACQWAFTDARIRRMLCCVQITSEQTEELCLCVRLCVVKWGAQQKKVGAVDIFFYCFLFSLFSLTSFQRMPLGPQTLFSNAGPRV